MTGVLLAAGAGDDPISAAVREAPIELRLEDSLRSIAAPIRTVSTAMVGVVIGSLAVHAVILATAVVTNRVAAIPAQQEIAVEIVQDAPKPIGPPKPVKPAEPTKRAEPVKLSEPVKAAAPPPPPPKLQQVKLEQAQLAPPKPPTPPKPEGAAPPSAAQTKAPAPPADANEIEALQKELSELRAQKAALKPAAQNPAAPGPASSGGALARSMQAVAMPSIGVDGELAGYQELVFSQLAKAKGDGEYRGQAGTTGVHFEVDATGQLLHAEVATSSGSPMLDKEALDIVHRAAPFPPPPQDADHGFFANVNFRPPKS